MNRCPRCAAPLRFEKIATVKLHPYPLVWRQCEVCNWYAVCTTEGMVLLVTETEPPK
jgi:hypothetical protein